MIIMKQERKALGTFSQPLTDCHHKTEGNLLSTHLLADYMNNLEQCLVTFSEIYCAN
jgi:hypothetical protein